MHELVVNLHMHTRYSDGSGTHGDIAEAALQAGIDVVIVTDHNVLVNGPENYYQNGQDKVLLLVGEEVHDPGRLPQKSHLLVLGANREMSAYADNPQRLLDCVRDAGGLSFLAHPFETPAPPIDEPDLSWVDWDVYGFTGIELWNAMSELKSRLKTVLHAYFFAFFPKRIALGPSSEALQKWDELLSKHRRVVAIGGTDAHAFVHRLGPFQLTLFPYLFHFRTINTHIFTPEPIQGDVAADRRMVIDALRAGHAFIGYDLPASSRGFRFTANGKDQIAWMGDEISAQSGVTLQVRLPQRAECRLIKDGEFLKVWRGRETCTHITSEPGVYRIEVYIPYLGRSRGWIFSNPIYVRD